MKSLLSLAAILVATSLAFGQAKKPITLSRSTTVSSPALARLRIVLGSPATGSGLVSVERAKKCGFRRSRGAKK